MQNTESNISVDFRLRRAFELMHHAHAKPLDQRRAFVSTTLRPMLRHFDCRVMRTALTRFADRVEAVSNAS